MAQVDGLIDFDAATDAELDVLERKIAYPFTQIFPTGVVIWGIANTAVWLSLWPLVFMGLMPLWLAFIIATFNVMLSYLPSHDAQHGIIAREGKPLRWLNEFVGHWSVIPLASPYRVLRATHMEHHRNTNDPELDPDHDTSASSNFDFFARRIGRLFGGRYAETLERLGKPELVMEAYAFQAVYTLILFGLALSGHAIEAALLWWLPRHVGVLWLIYYLAWMPHHPHSAIGRYADTRAFKSRMGNLWSGGMQYHIVHHLYPTIPLMQTPAAYRALRPILERKGCDLGGLNH